MQAFLALWNDVASGREAEYERWHTFEHVPERVAVPGMRGARAIEHIAARCAEAGGDFDGLEDRLRADGFVTFAVAVWDGRPHDADGSPVFSSPLSEET